MKHDLRRFAPFGLYLALGAAIAAFVTYVLQRQFSLILQICLGLIIIGLAVYAILDPGQVIKIFSGRKARYRSNLIIQIVAFVGIIIVINYLAYEYSTRWDLSEDKSNTLSQDTINVLAQLPSPVTAQAFYSPQIPSETASELLDQYAYASDGLFSYEIIDPINKPLLAEEAKITRDGTVVLTMANRQEQVEFVSEQELTSALIRLQNPGSHVVYFLTGHGEFTIEDQGDQSYAQLKAKLESKNYTVQSLNLLAENKIPDDASVIVIGGAVMPVSDGELSLLSAYLDGGGSLVIMAEPPFLTQTSVEEDILSTYLSETWGIIYGNNIVVDLTSTQEFVAISSSYGNSPITQQMHGLVTIFPTTRSVEIESAFDESVSQVKLILTSDQSWAENNVESLSAGEGLSPDEGADLLGPVSIAVSAENFTSSARVVAFGDSEFASNGYFPAYGNSDMIVNSIDWAVGEEELISLTPKENTQRIFMPPSLVTTGLIFLFSIIVIPAIVIAAGISVWLYRRKKG